MISIGITGSFSVGKSLILNILNQKNYKTFIADEVVREFYQDENIQKQIIGFHPALEGFNKKLITNLFFTDSFFKKRITNLVHPYIEKQLKIFIRENSDQQIIFSEIPLLFEANFTQYFNYITTVFCSEKTRLIRAKSRADFSFKKFRQIQRSQLSQIEKIKLAHFTVNTNINLLKLNEKIDQLIQKIKCQSSRKQIEK